MHTRLGKYEKRMFRYVALIDRKIPLLCPQLNPAVCSLLRVCLGILLPWITALPTGDIDMETWTWKHGHGDMDIET
jgi:hypothetical protein